MAALGVAGAAFVLVWFQPQKLLIDERVSDDLPAATDARPQTAGDDTPATSSVSSKHAFISRDHGTDGTVRIVQAADGRTIVRIEGLDTDNGPDLYLYLSTNTANGDEGAFDDDYVSLGRLKGNKGDQNYDLPEGVDVGDFRTVLIWCKRFSVPFANATLT